MSTVNEAPELETLVRDLAQPVMRYLERYTGSHAVAEDLWQETLLRIHRGLSGFAGRSSPRTWAFAIASRVAADYFRDPVRRARIVDLDEAEEPADPERTLSERLIIDEMNACVREVIDSLPAPYRAALILHDLEELPAEQVAEAADCSVAAAKIRIHRARLRLKQALQSQCSFYRDPESVFRCQRKE